MRVTLTLTKPSDLGVQQRNAGGDNEVPRDTKGRPLVIVRCYKCEGVGNVPSPKTGNPIKCQRCTGKGEKQEAYTRTTTFIDVLDDKSNLMAWGKRMVLIGTTLDPSLTDGVLDYAHRLKSVDEAEAKGAKDWLTRRAEAAADKAGASDKAEQGTFLHGLSELIDEHKPLPEVSSFDDVVDMHAYREATAFMKIRHMEQLVICDKYRTAGTPDRVSEWVGPVPLVAPDGYVFEPGAGELLITDLKTGSVDYGALKMAMQLAIYANSDLYDKATGERVPFDNINRKWGLIMHLPSGSGVHTTYWADLELGWHAVALAKQVREIRNMGKKALTVAWHSAFSS